MNTFIKLVILVSLLAVSGYTLYALLKKGNTPGKCEVKTITLNTIINDTNDFVRASEPGYEQYGYIDCTGGGELWHGKTMKIINMGKETIYIEYVQKQKGKMPLRPTTSLNLAVKPGPSPNIYIRKDSKTIPNVKIIFSE